jgi:uncharacterized protein
VGAEQISFCEGESMSFSPFVGQKYLNIETFRKNGEGVKTPVWFAEDPSANLQSNEARLYVYTIGASGKIKRIRFNSSVRIAPCDMRGTVKGDWVEARAEIVTGEEETKGMALLNKKYFPWKQVLDFFAMFSKRERIVFVIRPA